MHRWKLAALFLLMACNEATPGPVNVWIEGVEWGQTVIGSELRLVQFKPAELLVYARGDRAGLTANLEARAYQNGALLGSLPLVGPANLPQPGQSLNPELAYRAQLPLTWVAAGLQVEVVIDPVNQLAETNEADNAQSSTPAVGLATDLYLTVVPVTYLGLPPTIPDFEPKVYQRWPLHDLVHQIRAAYTFTGTLTSNSLSGWNALLSQLSALRALDQSQRFPGAYRYYYGFIKANYDSGFAGIGYIGLPVAVGWDKPTSADELMTHELGHNFGLAHAPCGGPANPDPDYPYPGASIGSWGIGLAQRQLKDPATFKDVMSYCANTWVSDYHYQAAQTFLENRPPNPNASYLTGEQVLISGWLEGSTWVLNPPLRYSGQPLLPRPGPYQLRLRGAQDLEVAFDLDEAVVEPGESGRAAPAVRLFSFSLPWNGALKAVEIRQGPTPLVRREARAVRQEAALALRANQTGSGLQLFWNIKAAPYLSLVYRWEQETHPLALWIQNGSANIDLAGLPQGATLEIWASDGVEQWTAATR